VYSALVVECAWCVAPLGAFGLCYGPKSVCECASTEYEDARSVFAALTGQGNRGRHPLHLSAPIVEGVAPVSQDRGVFMLAISPRFSVVHRAGCSNTLPDCHIRQLLARGPVVRGLHSRAVVLGGEAC
jgi:hypothetical protein